MCCLVRNHYFQLLFQWHKLLHSAYYDGMDALSKVTRYVRDVYVGYQEGVEGAQEEEQENGLKKEPEFEDLGDDANHSDETSVPGKVQSFLSDLAF